MRAWIATISSTPNDCTEAASPMASPALAPAPGRGREVQGGGEHAPLTARSTVSHPRAALVCERNRLTGRRLWLPFAVGVPAGLVVMIGIAQARPALQRYVWLEIVMFAVAMPLALLVGHRRARRTQARIDDLDALTGGS